MTLSWQSRLVFGGMCLSLISLPATLACAQDDGGGGLEIVELTGKLEAIVGNRVKIKTDDGKETIITLATDTIFKYSGTAEASILSPGLMVRFTAAFDPSGNPQTTLKELEIFRPAKVKRMTREVMQSQTPGIYPVGEKGNASQPEKAKTKEPAPQVSKTVVGGAQTFDIVGQVGGIQADRIQIRAGNRPLMLQMDPALAITVSSGDAMFCQPGDEVKLTGLKNPAGLVQAETVEVKGAKPLGAIDESKSLRGKATKRGPQGDQDADSKPATGKPADGKTAVGKTAVGKPAAGKPAAGKSTAGKPDTK